MEKIIDSHIHLNIQMGYGIKYFIDLLESNYIDKAVLILNSEEHWREFEDNIESINKLRRRIHIGLILDVHRTDDFQNHSKYLYDRGFNFSIKIHSRLSKLTSKDFDAIDRYLYTCPVKSIIVDAFYYGSNIENQIGMELSIHLARVFPDRKIIMAHFGGIKVLSAMLYTRDLKNIYYDISLTATYLKNTSVMIDLSHCIKYNVDRVMFGSDYPDCDLQDAIHQCKLLIDKLDVSLEEKDIYLKNLFWNNANKVFFKR